MMHFTFSEIGSYLRCPRQWSIRSHNGKRLQPKKQAKALTLGTLVHKGLEATLRGDPEPLEAIQDGTDDLVEMARQLVAHHNLRWGIWPFPSYKALDVEMTFAVPIPGTPHTLAGTMDAVLEDEHGMVWVVDHKTYKWRAKVTDMEVSWQFRGYVWAASQIWPDKKIGGFIYNGLAKKVPEPPKRLKNGKVSQSISELRRTSFMRYMVDIALTEGDPAYHQKALDYLRQPDELERWHTRHWIPRNLTRERSMLSGLASVANRMAIDAQDLNACPPNFRWEGCSDCGVVRYCHAVEHGEAPPLEEFEEGTYGTIQVLEEEGIL